MKIFISADIEGVTGICHWDETEKNKADYEYFSKQMTKEVCAACEGAIKAGATEIVIKDAHDSGRNLILSDLPTCAKVVRGWSGHPFSMVYGLDNSFDAAIFIGYHSPAYANGNPLAHTMNGGLNEVFINGIRTSEFLLHSFAAQSIGVPSVFISGDVDLTKHAQSINPNINVLGVNDGKGNSVTSIHPDLATKLISANVELALNNDLEKYNIVLPETFELKVRYNSHRDAYKASFYPGVTQLDERTVSITLDNYFDVLRTASFIF